MENADQILDAPETERIQLEYAGFWIRVVAYILDAILLYGVRYAISLAFVGLVTPTIFSIMSFLIGVCYFGMMESSDYQATLGKMAIGVKVGDRHGAQISILNAIGRHLSKIISALLLLIGFMMIGWDEKNQGLHDKLAGTYVFYGPGR